MNAASIFKIALATFCCMCMTDAAADKVKKRDTIAGLEDKTIEVRPAWNGTNVSLKEKISDSSVEATNTCGGEVEIFPNEGASCTFENTVFFEGIPTLSQYGLAIMALLMLGVGFVGFRRFV